MRLVMMATGPFAAPTFESLIESEHEVPLLMTRPTPPIRGRHKAPPNPMREIAQARRVPVLEPESINTDQARGQLRELRPDLLVVCDYGQILSAETLETAPLGGVNLHGSLLPKYRGAAPVNWAIYHGETETGVSVIHMTPRLDAGPVLASRTTPIAPDETAAELEPRLAKLGVEPVHEAIQMLAHWDRETVLGHPQDPALASKAPRLRKSQGKVDWSQSAEQIKNQVRAFQPWPGTFTHVIHKGEFKRLILERVAVVEPEESLGEPGVAVDVGKDHLHVACGRGVLSLEQVQPAGKRPMPIEPYLRGHKIQPGDRFE